MATTVSLTTITNALSLLDLPHDILVMLPEFLHDIEDYMNLSSTSRALRASLAGASPNAILRLAAASSRVFFRPSPHFLVCATARELGHWARASDANEAELATGLPRGIDHLLDLAARHCGLTMRRIRELYELRSTVVVPVSNIVDRCIGDQWMATPDFWDGGVDDAYTIYSDSSETFFHLAIYGELFGPEFDAFLGGAPVKKLKVDTRLEYVKYCVPDFATECFEMAIDIRRADGSFDPRRALVIHPGGPYRQEDGGSWLRHTHNLALTWLLKSTQWRPEWKRAREAAGAVPEFSEREFSWRSGTGDWRQNMLEDLMQCQGLEGLGMILPGAAGEKWKPKIKEWRDRIARLEQEPATTNVGLWETHEYPDLLMDLCICSSGYVTGT
ncbi:hypothetical protein AAE478_008222 [Parahypoxylon ruwenzoriense]